MLLTPSAPAAAATFTATTAEVTPLATTFAPAFRMHAGAATLALGAVSPTVATHAISTVVALRIEAAPVVAGCPLDAASATDQAVVAVAASVWFSIGSEPSAVGTIGVRSVRRVPVRSRAPRVVIVVVSTVPACVTDVGIVVINDGAPASPESPIAVPGVEAPAKAAHSTKYSEASEGGSQSDAGAE